MKTKKKIIIAIIVIIMAGSVIGTLWTCFDRIEELEAERYAYLEENEELREIVEHHEDELSDALFKIYLKTGELETAGLIDERPNIYHRDFGDNELGHFWNFNADIDTFSEYVDILFELAKG